MILHFSLPCNRTPAWHARVRHISCSLRRCALTGDDGTHQEGIHRSLLRAWLQGRGPATFGQLQVLPRGKQSSPLVALRRHCDMATARWPEPPSVAMLEYTMLDHTRLDHMIARPYGARPVLVPPCPTAMEQSRFRRRAIVVLTTTATDFPCILRNRPSACLRKPKPPASPLGDNLPPKGKPPQRPLPRRSVERRYERINSARHELLTFSIGGRHGVGRMHR